MSGTAESAIKTRAKEARFDERLAVLGLILDAILSELREVMQTENVMKELLTLLREFKAAALNSSREEAQEFLNKQIETLRKQLAAGKDSGSINDERRRELMLTARILEEMSAKIADKADGNAAFETVKEIYDGRLQAMKKAAAEAGTRLSNVFLFCEEVFSGGQEMVILVTELTISAAGAGFISRYGCKEYFRHNKELLFHERRQEILREIQELNLE